MGVDRYFEAQAEKGKAHWERELIKELKAEREELFKDGQEMRAGTPTGPLAHLRAGEKLIEWVNGITVIECRLSRLDDIILFLEQRWGMD